MKSDRHSPASWSLYFIALISRMFLGISNVLHRKQTLIGPLVKALPFLRVTTRALSANASSLPIPPSFRSLSTSEETRAARAWIDEFRRAAIPRTAVELSFARSSGPGGQVRASLYHT